MDTLIQAFPQELIHALQIGEEAKMHPHRKEIHNVCVCGLGGSGIGGTIAGELCADELRVPFIVNKDYHLPKFVNEHTLVIACSYSGNTEETLNVFDSAIKSGAKVVCITSGGKLAELAGTHELDCIMIPAGRPPRASLGYSLVQQFFVLNRMGLITERSIGELKKAAALIEQDQDSIKEEAKELAALLFNKIPIIYAAEGYGGVAVRYRQQFNENSKMLCWHHVLPEMNHNELVGWREKRDEWAVLLLRNETDYKRNQQRMEINKEIFGKYCNHIFEYNSKGESHIERALYLIHFGDWVSFYMSQHRNMDAVEVDVIDFLKGSLAEMDW